MESSETPAQLIFKNKELLTSRPEGMEFPVYRELLAIQNHVIKKLFKHKPMRRVAQLFR